VKASLTSCFILWQYPSFQIDFWYP